LPPWRRKSPKITEVLPLLYLHGLSSKDFIPALEEFLGSGAGLSAPAITRLTEAWQEEYRRWCERDLSGADYGYCWAGGLHFGVRLDADRVCTLVVIGVRGDGKKELVALADGHRESTESWTGLLRDARRRGTFSTVTLRTKVTKGPGSRAAGLAMVFKLIEAASDRWRYVNGPDLVALVRVGAKFEKGVLIERPDEAETKVAA